MPFNLDPTTQATGGTVAGRIPPEGLDFVTAEKQDIVGRGEIKLDSHLGVENPARVRDGPEVYVLMVDVFDSTVPDNDRAHVTSDAFPDSPEGAREASDFLRSYGFDVTVRHVP